jgi:hypothetical protein
LLGFLREFTPFQEVPIRLILRGRNESADDFEGVTTWRASQEDEVEPPELTELSEEQMLDPTEDEAALEQAWGDLESDDLLTLDDESDEHSSDEDDDEVDDEEGDWDDKD